MLRNGRDQQMKKAFFQSSPLFLLLFFSLLFSFSLFSFFSLSLTGSLAADALVVLVVARLGDGVGVRDEADLLGIAQQQVSRAARRHLQHAGEAGELAKGDRAAVLVQEAEPVQVHGQGLQTGKRRARPVTGRCMHARAGQHEASRAMQHACKEVRLRLGMRTETCFRLGISVSIVHGRNRRVAVSPSTRWLMRKSPAGASAAAAAGAAGTVRTTACLCIRPSGRSMQAQKTTNGKARE